jgi:hypothetical protein
VPCSLVVYGRPVLMVARVKLPEQYLNKVFTDRRGVCMVPRLEQGLWTFRPVEGFDLRGIRNPRIGVRHLVVDLVASPDPVGEWLKEPLRGNKGLRFNYGRSLV